MDPRRATIFGRYAEDYARWRPTYPAEAVDWLVPQEARRVVDVGAGTGKLTGALLERGLDVEAVEPDVGMLDVLRRLHPAAAAHLAGAQDLPLPDGSVDAVLVADAWHWFPHERAAREIRRVLGPGGRLGLVWNLVAPSEPWELELAGLDPDRRDGDHGEEVDQEPVVPGLPQAQTETATFPWTWQVTPDHWRANLATHSAYAVMEGAERERRLDTSRAIVAAVCAETGRATAPVGHETFCVRWCP